MRLIDADALADEMMKSSMPSHDIGGRYQTGFMDARSMVISAPTIDPVKRGKWIVIPQRCESQTFDECKCSVCGTVEYFNSGWKKFSYCPYCGAQMERSEE